MEVLPKRLENMVGRGENAGNPAFSHNVFRRPPFQGR